MLTLSKLVSLLGLVASVLAAISNQVGVISVKWGAVVMFLSAIAAAAGGGLSKYIEMSTGAVALGLVVALAAVFASPLAGDLFPPLILQAVAIAGTAAAAAGASLFGWVPVGAQEAGNNESK